MGKKQKKETSLSSNDGIKDLEKDTEISPETTLQAVLPTQLIQEILGHLEKANHIRAEDLPNIHLYMDQVTTLMEEELAFTKRNDEDKVLTKTMINNYAKSNVLPPPEKKKYSKDQLLILILIYYLKNVLVIRDIDKVLSPIISEFYHSSSEFSFADVYNEIIQAEENAKNSWHQSILDTWEVSNNGFEQAPGEHQDVLQLFSFICALSFDVHKKKLLLEKLIDQLPVKKEE